MLIGSPAPCQRDGLPAYLGSQPGNSPVFELDQKQTKCRHRTRERVQEGSVVELSRHHRPQVMGWLSILRLGAPAWTWLVFLAVVVLLVLDLGVLNRKLSAVYVAAGLLFGLWISCSAARCRLPCRWRSRAGA
jgi:hypothetical protein